MKRTAAGRFRGSVANPVACWEPDTIPKPDGLAGPTAARRSNAERTKAGHCPALFVMGSRSVRG